MYVCNINVTFLQDPAYCQCSELLNIYITCKSYTGFQRAICPYKCVLSVTKFICSLIYPSCTGLTVCRSTRGPVGMVRNFLMLVQIKIPQIPQVGIL